MRRDETRNVSDVKRTVKEKYQLTEVSLMFSDKQGITWDDLIKTALKLDNIEKKRQKNKSLINNYKKK